MISQIERVRVVGLGYGHHRPHVRVGPLLPKSWSQAKAWLGKSLPRRRLGFKHYLVRDEGRVLVVEAGVALPVAAYLPPKEWNGTAAS